jgi:hypothetical protein
MGQDCAEKAQLFMYEGEEPDVDAGELRAILETTNKDFATAVLKAYDQGGCRGAVARISHILGYHWERKTDSLNPLIVASIDLAKLFGYRRLASIFMKRFMERVWRPGDLVQAEDRIHRIGQKNNCTVTYFDAPGTIDQLLSAKLVAKQSTISQVVDGVDYASDEDAVGDIIGEIMKDMRLKANTSRSRRSESDVPMFNEWCDPQDF